MSSFTTPLRLEYINGRDWLLLQGFRYETGRIEAGVILVPAGFVTDFASIPRGLWNLFPPTGRYGKAAVIHDFLYRKSGVPRDVADRVFLDAMETLGVNWLSRHVIYRSVRIFGGGSYEAKS